jgi:hypothetical protein
MTTEKALDFTQAVARYTEDTNAKGRLLVNHDDGQRVRSYLLEHGAVELSSEAGSAGDSIRWSRTGPTLSYRAALIDRTVREVRRRGKWTAAAEQELQALHQILADHNTSWRR